MALPGGLLKRKGGMGKASGDLKLNFRNTVLTIYDLLVT